MAQILKYVAQDILTDLKQVYDDKVIQLSQVVYWTLIIGDRLRSQHIKKRESGAFLTIFPAVTVLKALSNTSPNIVAHRKYVLLPQAVYDFTKDKGINYIAYTSTGIENCPPRFTRVQFARTTPSETRHLYMDEYLTPSPKQPYFYRINRQIYFLGLEKVDVTEVEMGLYMTLDPLQSVDITQEFDFPSELLPILKREVLDLGRFSLMVPNGFTVNDGQPDETAGKVPTTKITSVANNVSRLQQDEQD